MTIFMQALRSLDAFERMTVSGLLQEAEEDMAKRLLELQAAFRLLLTEYRGDLERTRGLDHPANVLKNCHDEFVTNLRHAETTEKRLNALFYLALLPFPGCLNKLNAITGYFADHPASRGFLEREQEEIQQKLKTKSLKIFKLRHFCQILKAPQPGEKGVLRIFSLPYAFLGSTALNNISKEYILYVEPPMGVMSRHFWLRHFVTLEDPVIIGAGGNEDRAFLSTQQNIIPTRLAHMSYLPMDSHDQTPFAPMLDDDSREKRMQASTAPENNGNKKYDIVFNSTYDDMKRKRHSLFLDLLNSPELKDKKALAIGWGSDRNVKRFKKLVKKAGLEERVTTRANIKRSDIPKELSHCKAGVHLSVLENAPRCIAEYFRANIPAAVSTCMAGFDFDLLTTQTGRAATDDLMPYTLADMLDNLDSFAPRKWFEQNLHSGYSSDKLNTLLKKYYRWREMPWTEDITPLKSNGAIRYTNPDDYERMLPHFHTLAEKLNASGTLAFTVEAE